MEKEWETQRERRDEETCIVGGEGEGEKVDKGERKSENKQIKKYRGREFSLKPVNLLL